MIAQVSPGYEKAFSFLEQLGLAEENREIDSDRILDSGLATIVHRGRYELMLTDSNSQRSRYFDIGIRHLDTSEWIMSITSAKRAPDGDKVIEPWGFGVGKTIQSHKSLENFIRMNWPELLAERDQLLDEEDERPFLPTRNAGSIPEPHWFDPESQLMLNFVKSLFCWFRQQPA